MPRPVLLPLLLLCLAAAAAQAADLRGHGGPVGALALSADGAVLLSGSFDTRSILWDTGEGSADRVMRAHEGNVTAVAFLPGGRLATGGQDGRLAIWGAGGTAPERLDAVHRAPVAALAVSPDGGLVATAGWDGQVWIARPDGDGAGFGAHRGTVNGVGFLPDGRLASVGADLRLRIWSLAGDPVQQEVIGLPAAPSALAVTGDGLIAVASVDGALRLAAPGRGIVAAVPLSERPLVAVAAGGGVVAAASVEGEVWLLEAGDLRVRHLLQPGQGPVWALALDAAGAHLFTGGGDGLIRRWDAATGAALGTGAGAAETDYGTGRGAEVWRACAVCHTLDPDDGNRAGPTLHGIFGRRIGAAEGYDYSEALRHMDIVWTPETVSALFEHGPDAYTPGSRMPEQRIPDAEDRAALMEFLERATRP